MNEKSVVRPVSAEELAQLHEALATRHGARLKPGEGITVRAERLPEHVAAVLVLASADDAMRLELEAAVIPDDDHKAVATPDEQLDAAVDFCDAMLTEFLDNDRFGNFHDDWRLYDFDDLVVRFRAQLTHPNIDALADAWLAENGGDEPV